MANSLPGTRSAGNALNLLIHTERLLRNLRDDGTMGCVL